MVCAWESGKWAVHEAITTVGHSSWTGLTGVNNTGSEYNPCRVATQETIRSTLDNVYQGEFYVLV
jgi:hypothetical protein